ncbi:Hypothetical predicted protein [Mytilus galloprovincialis]|uniref:Uncharacterized protein n=1 Tax=Mytilus galloprovincialis TaxID=29158 RepID=A0A8B6FXN7_MYTGA|nr:Hypothetical predicted protein [Mytilus galloprovincialis]
MLETIKTYVISYDVLLYIFLSRAVYLIVYSTDENIVENKISSDRLDPDYLTNKQLFSLLDSRGEVYRRSADRSRLVALAKTKVNVEESTPPILADLESLTIPDLKHLLNQRGIMYYKRSTRHDLIGAVNISGPVTTEALAHMKRIGEPTIGPVHEFNAFNFKKTLEKYNDSIFLLNILPPRLKSSYFNESSWNALRRKLTYMDFKFGELDCDFEKRTCLTQKWNISTLFLYTPGKKINREYPIRDDYNLHSIFSDIQKEINYKISIISSWDIFTSSKWAFYHGPKDKIAVRIILFTNMTIPPMFLSSLSVKYRDKVNFGMVNMASHKGRNILKKLKQKYWPLLLVVTKQGILTYGKLPGEYFTYRELDFFLSTLLQDFQPLEKWYHKLSIFLDPTMIGLLIVRFLVSLLKSRIGIKKEEKTKSRYNIMQDVDDDDSMENRIHEAGQKLIIDQQAVKLLLEELLRRRNNTQ